MNYIAKTRVCIAADGSLVDAESDKSIALFAPVGATVPEKRLAGKKDIAKFFKKDAPEEVEPPAAAHKRVAAEPESSLAPKVVIKPAQK